jgi:thymidylate kinase
VPPVNRHPFVVVEGTTWVGKSTTARFLSRALTAKLLHLPPEFDRFRGRIRLDDGMAPLPRLAYWMAGMLHLSELVRTALAEGPVVCDRYIASPMGLLEADEDLGRTEISRLISPFVHDVVRPDFTLMLVADYRTALQRVAARSGSDRRITALHRRALGSQAHFCRWEDAVRHRARGLGPVEEMRTDAMTLAQMRHEALARVTAGLA